MFISKHSRLEQKAPPASRVPHLQRIVNCARGQFLEGKGCVVGRCSINITYVAISFLCVASLTSDEEPKPTEPPGAAEPSTSQPQRAEKSEADPPDESKVHTPQNNDQNHCSLRSVLN